MIDLALLRLVFHHMAIRGVPYVWGGKAPTLMCDSSQITGLDCSGFTRYALARAGLVISDGSVNQHDYCKDHALPEIKYEGIPAASASQLFIAFIAPVAGAHPGHVWLVNDRWSMESCGNRGVCARSWDYPVLAREVCACYELPVKP